MTHSNICRLYDNSTHLHDWGPQKFDCGGAINSRCPSVCPFSSKCLKNPRFSLWIFLDFSVVQNKFQLFLAWLLFYDFHTLWCFQATLDYVATTWLILEDFSPKSWMYLLSFDKLALWWKSIPQAQNTDWFFGFQRTNSSKVWVCDAGTCSIWKDCILANFQLVF